MHPLQRNCRTILRSSIPLQWNASKSCLNSTRGQGRYLQAVFPEEMKAVKSGIDAIGHEINEITASLGTVPERKKSD